MKKNRYLLCLLVCGFLLYFAVPKLSLTTGGAQEAFSLIWLSFALIVIAGNLTGLLYHPRKKLQQTGDVQKQRTSKKRSFH
jgi:hypothetical protein